MDLRTLHEIVAVKDPIERARVLSRLMTEGQGLLTEAAKLRRQAIADARDAGLGTDEIAGKLGVTPARVSQMRKGPAAIAPAPAISNAPRVLVQRALPTDPATRASASLFLVEAEKQGLTAGRQMLYIGHEAAHEHIAACLGVDPGDTILARRKKMTANDVPVRIATSYFRADLFDGTRIAEPEFVKPSLQAALAALGYQFGHAEESLTARPATVFETKELELDPGEWVVQIVRASYSSENTPVHVLETICAASRHVFPIGQVAGADQF